VKYILNDGIIFWLIIVVGCIDNNNDLTRMVCNHERWLSVLFASCCMWIGFADIRSMFCLWRAEKLGNVSGLFGHLFVKMTGGVVLMHCQVARAPLDVGIVWGGVDAYCVSSQQTHEYDKHDAH